MRSIPQLLFILFLSFSWSVAHAIPVTVDNPFLGTQLVGSNGIQANNTTYDVLFLDGSYNSLYVSGDYQIPFATKPEADNAVRALLADTFQGTNFGQFPSATWGCFSNSTCRIYTVYGEPETDGFLASLFINQIGATDLSNIDLPTGGLNLSTNTGAPISGSEQVFAVWSLADSSTGGGGNNGGDDNTGGDNGGGGDGNGGDGSHDDGGVIEVSEPPTTILLGLGLVALFWQQHRQKARFATIRHDA